ncbi:ATP-binding protein [Streptomyces sp. JL3001]|uniref:ATP-binding protein n=1 Tax=Streptomyces sp. JL3001 TaxID=3400923 RepID=UPI003B28D72E
MGKKKNNRRKRGGVPKAKTLVNIQTVLGGANFGAKHDRHHEEARHVTPTVRPAQLPPRDPEFTGRDSTVASLSDEVKKGGALALTGQPGVGKTALAVELAYTLLPAFPDAQLYVNLSTTGDSDVDIDRALERLLRALGVQGEDIPNDLEGKVSQYRSALSGRACIVVLDNATSERQARYLVSSNPDSVSIITSRNSLSGLAGIRRVRLEQLPIDSSIDILARVIGNDRVDAERKEAEQIADLCGGIPLALRISANKLRDRNVWSLAYYAGKLRDERRRLEVLRSGDLEVRSSFLLSYLGLNERQQQVFKYLGMLPPQGFSGEIVSALSGLEPDDVESALEALFDANLVLIDAVPGRYQIHDLMRVFSYERMELEEGGEAIKKFTLRLVQFYCFMAHHADNALFDASRKSVFDTPERATDWFELEHVSLTHVVRLASREGFHDYAIGCARNMSRFLERRLHGNSWKVTSRVALESARETGEIKLIIEAIVEVVRCAAKFPSRDVPALALLEEANDLAKDIGSPSDKGQVAYELGKVAKRRGEMQEAERLLSSAVSLARQSKSYHLEGNSLLALGDVLAQGDDLDRAEHVCRQARFLFHSRRDRHCTGNAWKEIGRIREKLGDWQAATHFFKLAAQCYEYVHDLHCAGMSYLDRAEVLRHLGQSEKEIELYEKACTHFVALRDKSCLARTFRSWAELEFSLRHYDAARELFSQALSLPGAHHIRCEYMASLRRLAERVESEHGTEKAEPFWEMVTSVSQDLPRSGHDRKPLVSHVRGIG